MFLLCTDGFWEYIDETAMLDALAQAKTPAEWLRVMEREVVLRGGREQDNFSALAVWCRERSAANGTRTESAQP